MGAVKPLVSGGGRPGGAPLRGQGRRRRQCAPARPGPARGHRDAAAVVSTRAV